VFYSLFWRGKKGVQELVRSVYRKWSNCLEVRRERRWLLLGDVIKTISLCRITFYLSGKSGISRHTPKENKSPTQNGAEGTSSTVL
jgi:hypothetical protein